MPARRQPRQERKPQQADGDRQHADVQADQREHAEEPRVRPSASRRPRESRARTACRWTSAPARRAPRLRPRDTESAASSGPDARATCPRSAVNVQNASSTWTCAIVDGSGPSLRTVGDDAARLERDALERQPLDRRIRSRRAPRRPGRDQTITASSAASSTSGTRASTRRVDAPRALSAVHDGLRCHAPPPGRAPSSRAPRTRSGARGT